MHVEAVSHDQHRTFPVVPPIDQGNEPAPEIDRFLTIHEVMRLTSLGKTAIYARIGRGEFPRPIPLSKTKVAWSARDLACWQRDLRATRKAAAA